MMTGAKQIRPIAICLFSRGERILVAEGFDAGGQYRFCRPVGGGIEFGESSREAVLREIAEEMGAEVENLKLVGVLENIFEYEGQRGHEIVFVYDAVFADQELYQRSEINGYRHETDERFKLSWKSVDEMEANGLRLVPKDLVRLLAS